jgi:hypothetical protein
VVGAVCLVALPSPRPAAAGTFTALSCHDAAAEAVGTRGWSVGSATGEYITYGASCAGAGRGSFGLTMGPDPTGEYFNGDGNTITYTVPAGMAILNYSLSLYAFGGPCVVQDSQCANGFGDVFVDHTGQSDPNYDYRNLGYGAATTTVRGSELSGVDDVSVGVGCDPGQDLSYPCSGQANPEAQALVSGGSFTLLDATVPSVSNVTGSLVAGGVLTGTDTISFTGADSGGGVYSASVLVDGRPLVSEVPGTNDGLCVNLAPPGSAAMAFASPQPCPTVENISIPVDTTQLSPGQHQLQVSIEDAAGEEATAYNGTITVSGSTAAGSSAGSGDPGPCSPAALRGAASGTSALDQAKLTAGWIGGGTRKAGRGASKATLTSRYGTREQITGRLTGAGGAGVADAAVDVCETPAGQGAQTVLLARTSTGTSGQWSLTLPRDVSSGALRFVYLSPQDGVVPLATAILTLRVHAGIALRITPRITSVGRRIVFSGTLHGTPIPPGGKQLVLEASSGGEWIEFRTITTNAKGHYKAGYRFKFPGPISYEFRVLCPHEADFPFLKGTSNTLSVFER